MDSTKIFWSKIAEELSDKGGSYPFSGGTCHRMWDQTFGNRASRESSERRH